MYEALNKLAENHPDYLIGIAIIAAMALVLIVVPITVCTYESYRLYLRHRTIVAHGWPPKHCDADGQPVTVTEDEDDDDRADSELSAAD